MKHNDTKKIPQKTIVFYFIIFFAIISFVGYFSLYRSISEMDNIKLTTIKEKEKTIILLESRLLGSEFDNVIADLIYLRNSYLQSLSHGDDPLILAENWQDFSVLHKVYDQIRFIDIQGQEVIRINYANNFAAIVSKENLQNKADRYYFSDAIILNNGQVYISKLDLNIEHGEIEIPYKPMIRFATPVYDDVGKLHGVVVINYLAENLIENFKKIGFASSGSMYLVNSDGYYLSSNDPEEEWGFMFPEKADQTLGMYLPAEWKRIKGGDQSFITSNGLFTSTHIILDNGFTENLNVIFNEDELWAFSMIAKDDAEGYILDHEFWNMTKRVFHESQFYIVLTIVISILLSISVAIAQNRYYTTRFLSEIDPLTNVYNRRAGIKKIENLVNRSKRTQEHFGVCMVDVNGLKEVNDRLGHEYGNECIKIIVDILERSIRDTDDIFRYGGDEFVIIVNGVNYKDSRIIWNRIAKYIDDENSKNEHPFVISISHGMAVSTELKNLTIENIMKLADERMYNEKHELKKNLSIIRKME